MGLRETLSKGAQTAFTAAGDVPESATYYQIGSTSYDVSSGVASVPTTSYVASFIFTSYKNYELNNEHIEPADVKGIIPQANISALPVIDDYLFRVEAGASVRYDVVAVEKDPADALWKLQLRKP